MRPVPLTASQLDDLAERFVAAGVLARPSEARWARHWSLGGSLTAVCQTPREWVWCERLAEHVPLPKLGTTSRLPPNGVLCPPMALGSDIVAYLGLDTPVRLIDVLLRPGRGSVPGDRNARLPPTCCAMAGAFLAGLHSQDGGQVRTPGSGHIEAAALAITSHFLDGDRHACVPERGPTPDELERDFPALTAVLVSVVTELRRAVRNSCLVHGEFRPDTVFLARAASSGGAGELRVIRTLACGPGQPLLDVATFLAALYEIHVRGQDVRPSAPVGAMTEAVRFLDAYGRVRGHRLSQAEIAVSARLALLALFAHFMQYLRATGATGGWTSYLGQLDGLARDERLALWIGGADAERRDGGDGHG